MTERPIEAVAIHVLEHFPKNMALTTANVVRRVKAECRRRGLITAGDVVTVAIAAVLASRREERNRAGWR